MQVEQIRRLSPALARAWEVLAVLPPDDLATRPGRALADNLGVDPGLASRYLSRLSDLGVVSKVGGRAVSVRQIADHAPDSDLRSGVNVDVNIPDGSKVNIPASVEKEGVPVSTLTSKGSKDLSPSPETPSDIVRKVRATISDPGRRGRGNRVAREAGAGTPPQELRADTDLDALLLDAYRSRRRRVDPTYDPPRAHAEVIHRARIEFQKRGLPTDRWGDYLDDLFERFPVVTRGECLVPPARVIAADGFLDRFLATLPPRKLDTARALRMLRTAGFGDLGDHLITAITIAREVRTEGAEALDDDGIPSRMRAAILWTLEHFDEIGTVTIAED